MKPIHAMTRFEKLIECSRLRLERGITAQECLDYLAEHSPVQSIDDLLKWLRSPKRARIPQEQSRLSDIDSESSHGVAGRLGGKNAIVESERHD